MKASEILSKAADLIEPDGAWIQGKYSTTYSGEDVSSNSPAACRFCAWGAIERAAGRHYDDAEETAIRTLYEFLGGDIEAWNDVESRTQAEVVAAMRQAASLAREREAT